MDRLLENPLMPLLVLFSLTYFLIGTLRKEQYMQYGAFYKLDGAQAVKFGLLTISALLFLGLDIILHLSKIDTDFKTFEPTIYLVLPVILGVVLYFVFYLREKKIKSFKANSSIIFRLYIGPVAILLFAIVAFLNLF